MATEKEPTWRRRTRMPAEQRREHLLDAAAEVILANGFDNLTMEAITDHAGVSKALGYSYFNRLDDLFHELFDREFSVIYERVGPAIAAPGTLEERIARKVRTYFDVIEERHDLFLILNRNLTDRTYRAERRERQGRWAAWVAELIEAEFRAPEQTALALARLLMTMDDQCVQLWTRSAFPRDEMERLCIDFQLAGLRAVLEPRTTQPPGTGSERPGREPAAPEPAASTGGRGPGGPGDPVGVGGPAPPVGGGQGVSSSRV